MVALDPSSGFGARPCIREFRGGSSHVRLMRLLVTPQYVSQ